MKTLIKICITSVMILPAISAQIINSVNGGISGSGYGVNIGLGGTVQQTFVPGPVNNPSGKSSTDGTRNVFWVHGLNGDIGSWIRASTASEFQVATNFPARKLRSVSNFTYGQTGGLLDAGRQVNEVIRNTKDNDPSKDFIIAHSQGGMVSRGLLYLNYCTKPQTPPSFGGLVTFCSPHQGALVLNNKSMFDDLTQEMCESMAKGPVQERINNLKFKFTVLSFIKISISGKSFLSLSQGLIDEFCNGFSKYIYPLIQNAETPGITTDYEVGARLLNEMNQCTDGNNDLSKFPKVAFYGVEPKNNLMARTLLWFFKSSQIPTYFEANDDQYLIDAFQENFNKYYAKYTEWKNKEMNYLNLYNACKKMNNNCLQYFALANEAAKMSNYWLEGIQFMQGLDDKYKRIIGALVIKLNKKYYCICEDPITGRKSKKEIAQPSECIKSDLCAVEGELEIERIEKDSDGVVLAESASNLPGATFPPQEMKNSSHMQARNDLRLRDALYLLYEGGTDIFFKTNRK
ncbi:MAG: GPI inositol-deacylase [Saprospiraceae bacterium]|nr:GPI inositol-deacylase [Saprospiraceae bacterium]HMW38510.1 hypothetical protein [Saprospiraceae bacterium]HMX88356.1 hypothetical protein [Saprospiraceae bacterium]HMZ40248.1 hypothetical protein [Saprospiraceae bacterium]HNC35571.1 hypothetical protein [Saprospiraceae bacterium]